MGQEGANSTESVGQEGSVFFMFKTVQEKLLSLSQYNEINIRDSKGAIVEVSMTSSLSMLWFYGVFQYSIVYTTMHQGQ